MSVRFAVDENFDMNIIRGLQLKAQSLDMVFVHDEGMSGSTDEEVLEWAASQDRVLLTQDIQTLPILAYRRVEQGLHMSGVIVVPQRMAMRQAIDDLLLIAECCSAEELQDRVLWLPL